MTLTEGDYPIAEGYTCYISHRTIHVKKKVQRCRETGDYRCIDCKHRKPGKCFVHRRYETDICTKKPKMHNGDYSEGLFYCAPASRKACEMFELKDNDTE